MIKLFNSKVELWTIRLREVEGWVADNFSQHQAMTTLKFSSYNAALAYARRGNYNPIDYVICRTRFFAEDIEAQEINYSSTSIAVAGNQK